MTSGSAKQQHRQHDRQANGQQQPEKGIEHFQK
jgi:hypothetical protein